MNFFHNIAKGADRVVGNVVSAGVGFVEGLTGASAAKKAQAKEKQRKANEARRKAEAKAAAAKQSLQSAVRKASRTDMVQDKAISAAQRLANRSLSTASAAQFESRALRNLVGGIRKDLKSLSATSASAAALKETNETIAEIGQEIDALEEASAEHRKANEEAIQALNEEAMNTTAHLEALTAKQQESGRYEQVATDVLPWARTALAALNLERPTNSAFYYLYLAAGPFLQGRGDITPAMRELILTGLQIGAYWDDDGIEGLFRSRALPPALDDRTREDIKTMRADVEAVRRFLSRQEVKKALDGANISPPALETT